MAFAPRPRTPVRRQSNETSGTGKETTSTPVRATPYAVASGASSANGTIQRLLDIVTQHGVQLASLKEDQEALRREVIEALRGVSSPGGEKAPLNVAEVGKAASQKGRVGEGTTKAANLTEARRTSLCSTSSGSDAGGSTSSSRRSGRTLAVPKVNDLAKEKSSDSKPSEREEKCHPASAIPVPRLRSRSSSLPTTPRGANATGRSITPRRSASGEPTRRNASATKPSNLYEIAKPLLQPGILREKRVVALSSFARCLKDGASPCHWSGPQTPLRCAVQAQDTEMAKLLIQARADPNERDAKGVCVLHSASFDGLTDLCQTLLKARADANLADQHGQTAFFFAPSSSVCDILVENKADVNAVNQKGQSALHLASRAGLTEVLLWMAPRVSREIMEMRDIHGATAAYYARHAGITGEFLMRHKFTGEVAAESEKRGPSDRRNVARGSNDSQPDTHQGSRSSKTSWTSRGAPLPPLLEDQLDGEDDDAVAVVDTKEESQEVVAPDPLEAVAADPLEVVEAPEEPELPGSTSLSTLEELPEELHTDMEVTSCYLEERSCELSIEPKESSLEVDHEQMEVTSPTSSLDRADQMVTWEEDCGCPGFALTTSTEGVVSESPTEAAPEDGNSAAPEDGNSAAPEDGNSAAPEDGNSAAPEDGNSVASDASDLASPSKVRNKRRASLNQVFLRPLDPLKAEA